MTPTTPARRTGLAIAVLVVGLAGVLLVVALLYRHAAGGTNQVALADLPKGVTTASAASEPYQPSRRYVGAVEPWLQAKVGPQLLSAYVDTVLVRPGAQVKRGDVIATLDCRNASAVEQAVSMQARAVAAQQTATASEAARTGSLLKGGFVSQNEVDQKQAESASQQAQVLALRAQAAGRDVEVGDCVQRAPFDGEIGERTVDPGAFVRPGSSIATVVDRRTVRVTAEVPETDFDAVADGTPVRLHFLSTGRDLTAPISRRAPSADPGTRTIHLEIDVDDAARALPVWTTAELSIDVGTPRPASAIPVTAATVRGDKVTTFVVEGGVARLVTVPLVGERAGTLFVDPQKLPAGSRVVVEGRAALDDGDHVRERAVAP